MDDNDRPTGFHPINIGHLVMGVAILAGLGCWGLVQSDTVTGDDIHWLLPVPWVLAGVVGLVATAITGSRRYAVRQTGWVGDQTEETEAQPRPEPPVDATAPLTVPQNPKHDPDEETP
jgi:hypothetical protein